LVLSIITCLCYQTLTLYFSPQFLSYQVLANHIFPGVGALFSIDMYTRLEAGETVTITSLSEKSFAVTVDTAAGGILSIDGIPVSFNDVISKNGVIHMIDGVLWVVRLLF
jgi:uncharacterized surface protein with fasciclin (FAS1) repeats